MIDLSWKSPSGMLFKTVMTFEEDETFKAFQKFKANNPDEKIRLRITIGDLRPTIEVELRNDKYILDLKKCKVKVYKK